MPVLILLLYRRWSGRSSTTLTSKEGRCLWTSGVDPSVQDAKMCGNSATPKIRFPFLEVPIFFLGQDVPRMMELMSSAGLDSEEVRRLVEHEIRTFELIQKAESPR